MKKLKKPTTSTQPPIKTNRRIRSLAEYKTHWGGCKNCRLSDLCNRKVFFRGKSLYSGIPKTPDLLFIGEAPGETEYINQIPFHTDAPAGEELQTWITRASRRDEFSYACVNAVLCYPRDDIESKPRAPLEDEVFACHEHLIDLHRTGFCPRAYVLLGKIAEQGFEYAIEGIINQRISRCLSHPPVEVPPSDCYCINPPTLSLPHPSYVKNYSSDPEYHRARAVLDLEAFVKQIKNQSDA